MSTPAYSFPFFELEAKKIAPIPYIRKRKENPRNDLVYRTSFLIYQLPLSMQKLQPNVKSLQLYDHIIQLEAPNFFTALI